MIIGQYGSYYDRSDYKEAFEYCTSGIRVTLTLADPFNYKNCIRPIQICTNSRFLDFWYLLRQILMKHYDFHRDEFLSQHELNQAIFNRSGGKMVIMIFSLNHLVF